MDIYRMIQICQILLNADAGGWYFWAEHDIIGITINPEQLSEHDKKSLWQLGVEWSQEYNSYIVFV